MVTSTREARLAATFVTLADTLVAGYDVVDLLDTLVNASADLLDAAAAGLILADEAGELSVIASTSERSRLVEIMQLRYGLGPCVECYKTGRVVTVPDVDKVGDKWPDFREAALEQGLHSVHAVPLRLRGTVIGALNLFRNQTGVMSDEDILAARALADIATIGILHERTVRESDVAKQQLQHALDSRVLIEQAKGVLAHTRNIDMDDAFRALRDYARGNGLLLRNVAEAVVNRSLVI
jgi:GAF domain-containing protein